MPSFGKYRESIRRAYGRVRTRIRRLKFSGLGLSTSEEAEGVLEEFVETSPGTTHGTT